MSWNISEVMYNNIYYSIRFKRYIGILGERVPFTLCFLGCVCARGRMHFWTVEALILRNIKLIVPSVESLAYCFLQYINNEERAILYIQATVFF